jgi:hypothetical protein
LRTWWWVKLRLRYWRVGHSDSFEGMRHAKPPEEATEDEKEELAFKKPRILMEEFVALKYLSFIKSVLEQIRRLLAFVATAFVLLLISVNSYPFQSQRMFDLVACVLFVLLGAVL